MSAAGSSAPAGRIRPARRGQPWRLLPRGRTWWAQAFAMGLLLPALGLAAGSAHAHAASDAFLTLRVDGARVEQRLDIALRDLDRALDLDVDRDGQLRWGELRTRWPAFEQLVDAALPLRAGDRPCTRVSTDRPQLDRHTGGVYAVLRRQWNCPGLAPAGGNAAAPAGLALHYRLFETIDPTHRGIARVERAGAGAVTRVLVPGETAVLPIAAVAASGGAAGFFASGLQHIAAGLDHVLFLVTLLLVAVWRRGDPAPDHTPAAPSARRGRWVPRTEARGAWAEALRIVSAFTVAHSITLGLAAAGILAPPARWIEPLIAVSVLVAALDNLRPFLPGPRWATVAVFGLVHGFGFAGPLQDLGLRGAALAVPLLAFNLGVEAGQLLIVLALLPLALAWRHGAGYRRWIVRPVSAGVALLALAWTLERALALPLPA